MNFCAENMRVGGRSGCEYNAALGELGSTYKVNLYVSANLYKPTSTHLISIELL